MSPAFRFIIGDKWDKAANTQIGSLISNHPTGKLTLKGILRCSGKLHANCNMASKSMRSRCLGAYHDGGMLVGSTAC